MEEAIQHLKYLLYQIAEVKIKRKIPVYEGPDIESSSVLAVDTSIKDSFTVENIKYERERDRDVIDILLTKVYQLGFSVGYENSQEKHKSSLKLLNEMLKSKKK